MTEIKGNKKLSLNTNTLLPRFAPLALHGDTNHKIESILFTKATWLLAIPQLLVSALRNMDTKYATKTQNFIW